MRSLRDGFKLSHYPCSISLRAGRGSLSSDLPSHHDCLGAALWLRTGMPSESPPLTAGTRGCVLCGQTFREADMIHIGGSWVCAACKPLFVQRMKEGVGPTSGFRDLSRLTAW